MISFITSIFILLIAHEYDDCAQLLNYYYAEYYEDELPPLEKIGDAYCDNYFNTSEYDYDGGDCCHRTCKNNPSGYECGVNGFCCKNPDAEKDYLKPSSQPSAQPSKQPSSQPTSKPSTPSGQSSCQPSMQPSGINDALCNISDTCIQEMLIKDTYQIYHNCCCNGYELLLLSNITIVITVMAFYFYCIPFVFLFFDIKFNLLHFVIIFYSFSIIVRTLIFFDKII
jgi:hypothetical protein